MNYVQLINGLIKEAKRGIQFERFPKAFKVLAIIGLLPIILLSILSIAAFYILLFIYKALSSPIEFLHKIVRSEGEIVKHGTQVVIYLCCFPLIFTLYVLYSIVTVIFYFCWFVVILTTYLATLGGIRWLPFITDAYYDEEEINWDVKPSLDVSKVLIILTFALFVIILALNIVVNINPTLTVIADISLGFTIVYDLVIYIVNPIVYKKKIKAKEEKEVTEEVQEA